MELEHFVREDIKTFLDQRRSEIQPAKTSQKVNDGVVSPEDLPLYAPSRDYSKELHEALHAKDMDQARKILEQLKEDMETYRQDSPEWAERKRLLEGLYHQFQKTTQPPVEDLTDSEEQGILQAIEHIEALVDRGAYTSAINTYTESRQALKTMHLQGEKGRHILHRFQELYMKLQQVIQSTRETPGKKALEHEEQKLTGTP